jgi:Transposase zinc-binding domain/Putative transposase
MTTRQLTRACHAAAQMAEIAKRVTPPPCAIASPPTCSSRTLAHAGHVSPEQLKVMSAIERCRTAALGGHVARCAERAYTTIAYNSCRNRHCPKCQGAAAKQWLADREAELLPVPYYHVVFTLPAAIADIAYQNKAVLYDMLFKVSAATMLTIAADPKHLGARIGITSVLHTWGSALTHHPHVHKIVGQVMEFDPTRRSFVCRFTVAQLVASARFKSASSPAALKSP